DLVLQPVTLEAVTVTAMLREQELKDVPFSVAAATAQVLRSRGADNIEAIAANVAGFAVQDLGPGQSQPAIRGASSGQIARGQRSGVRAAFRIAPSGRFSIVPRIVYQDVKMDGWNRIDVYNILANPFTTSRPPVTLGPRQHFTQMQEPFTDKFLLTDLSLKYN